MAFNWSDHPVETDAFDWNSHPLEEEKTPSVSGLESGVRGAAQGLSFGFADEGAGALEAAKDWLMNDPQSFMDNYRKHRDESRASYRDAEAANPATFMSGQVAGALAPALLTAGGSTAATIGNLAAQGAAQGLGASEADLTQGDVGGAARDAAIGGAIGGAAGVAGKALSKIPVKKAFDAVSGRLNDAAKNLAVKATGATGRQAENFAPGAGRELLDRGIVRFGQTPEDVAIRAAKASEEAGQAIESSLKSLEARGVTGSVDNVIQELEQKVQDLSKVPGNEKIIRQLQSEIDTLYERGVSDLPISTAEEAKRAFQGQTNYASPEAEKKASAQVASAFKDEVERSALKADPSLAGKFTEAKKTYGLLQPIKEAAERRAFQLNQSPFGGFGDFAAGAAGSVGGPGGISASVAGRRLLAPRLASSGAVMTDYLSKIVSQSPQMLGKFAKPLQQAAARGGNSLAATHFVLQQTNPEYREMMLTSPDDEDTLP